MYKLLLDLIYNLYIYVCVCVCVCVCESHSINKKDLCFLRKGQYFFHKWKLYIVRD